MLALVRTESFYSFEKAYVAVYNSTYAEAKRQELSREHVAKRVVNTKKSIIEAMNAKGISTERILGFVDSARYSAFEAKEFVNLCKRKDFSEKELIELINDIGLVRIKILLQMCEEGYKGGNISLNTLRRLILLIAIMLDLRINTYSLLSRSGAFDNWCKSDELVIRSSKFLKKLTSAYEVQLATQIEEKIKANHPDITESECNKQVKNVLVSLMNSSKCSAEYGLDEKVANMYALLHNLLFMMAGKCEWYWNED